MLKLANFAASRYIRNIVNNYTQVLCASHNNSSRGEFGQSLLILFRWQFRADKCKKNT